MEVRFVVAKISTKDKVISTCTGNIGKVPMLMLLRRHNR